MQDLKVANLHLGGYQSYKEMVVLLGRQIEIQHIGCSNSLDVMLSHMGELDGQVTVIALQGVTKTLTLGGGKTEHLDAHLLFEQNLNTPVVDGSGIRDAMERWSIRLAAEQQPGLWSRKRVLMAPGLNHKGLAEALGQYADELRYADPILYFYLPNAPLVGRVETLNVAEGFTLSQLRSFPFARLFPGPGTVQNARSGKSFHWADIIAGDIGAIRRYAPESLKGKIVVSEYVSSEDIEDLKERGVSQVVTTMPPLQKNGQSVSAAVFEACLTAIRPDESSPLNENTYLNLMADLEWEPCIRTLQPEDVGINRFAFVIHPLDMGFIHAYRPFRWTKYLPDILVERVASHVGPLYLSRIKGIFSPATGQKVEGYLLALGATPRELMRHDPGFVYRRLIKASRMAERRGARIMGLGAFTSVVGDAGVTVAQKADIAITSGNSLTVAATLEAAKQAVIMMGNSLDLSHEGHVMVVGATGSIGSVCSRLLAQAGPSITLVAPRPEKLIALKRQIEQETPGARVTISTSADDYVEAADLIVTTTTALGTRIIDISRCKPGAVICDIARPPDITEKEAALRPDVLVIESGEILLPGNPDFGYDIGLPPGVAYACLAETALLAMEGRYEDFTLGRQIDVDRVKEIYKLFKKHGLQLSGLRSHGRFLTNEDIAEKRETAERFRKTPELLEALRVDHIRPIPQSTERNLKKVTTSLPLVAGLSAVLLLIGAIGLRRFLKNEQK